MTAGRQLLLLPPVRPLGERLGREFFRAVPPRPGVYLMCGHGDGVLYVGKAKDLRRRLGSYRSANTERLPRKLRRLLVAVERIHWDECADEATALERERELLLTLRPRFNTVGVWPTPALRLGWEAQPDAFTVGIGPDADDLAHRSGPLRRLRPVYAALLRLTWAAAHPELPWPSMPSRLLGERPPATWRWRSDGSAGLGPELHPRLTEFFTGRSSDLVDWLVAQSTPGSTFDLGWQTQDADRVRECFAKLSASRTDP